MRSRGAPLSRLGLGLSVSAMPRSCAARTSLVASMRSSTSVGRIWWRNIARIRLDVPGIRKVDGGRPDGRN